MKKVLVVQDDKLNGGLNVRLLEEEYEVLTANDGIEALQMARKYRPDIVLMDMSLPVMDGWEATRRFKIDEMPQLIQVLTGHMSLVGPRPTLPDQTDAYDDFRRQRLLVRPGITGLAQIHGNTALSWDQRILFDIAYVRRCSFLLDLSILLRTCWAIPAGDPVQPPSFQETRYAKYVTPPEGYETLPPSH